MAVYEFAPKTKNEKQVWICDGDTFLNDRGDWVEIKHDWDCDSPREYDNLGTFYTWLRSYSSPDDAPDYVEDLFGEFDLEEEWEEADCANPLMWLIEKLNELGHYALPVAAYIHSGIVYRVGSPSQFPDSQWDAGYAGLIFVTKEKVSEWLMVNDLDKDVRKRVNRCLADEVEYYSEWAEGCTYGYVMTDHETLEEDSCWGFIGSDAVASGITDYTGDLHDTNLDYDEWYEQCEERIQEEQEVEDFENMVGTTAASDSYAA